jgi:hypothetical protein
MLTDTPTRKKNRESFSVSDRTKALELPHDGQLVRVAGSIESAIRNGAIGDIRVACAEFLGTASDFYNVPPCPIGVLTARPPSRAGILDDGAFRRLSPFDDADPSVDENGRSEGDHFIRNFSEYALS